MPVINGQYDNAWQTGADSFCDSHYNITILTSTININTREKEIFIKTRGMTNKVAIG